MIDSLPIYDVVYIGDVIEHFEKDEGRVFWRRVLDHSAKAVIVVTPLMLRNNGAMMGMTMSGTFSLEKA